MSASGSYRGQCFCGAVTVEVSGDPVAAGICHCESCRKWHGAPINFWAIWPDAQVAIPSGQSELTEFNKAGASGRTSCKRCGSALLNRKPKIGMTVVYAMTLAGSGFAYAPTFHCYYGEGVVHLADGLPKFEDLPKPLGGSGKQFDEPARTELRR